MYNTCDEFCCIIVVTMFVITCILVVTIFGINYFVVVTIFVMYCIDQGSHYANMSLSSVRQARISSFIRGIL